LTRAQFYRFLLTPREMIRIFAVRFRFLLSFGKYIYIFVLGVVVDTFFGHLGSEGTF